MYQIDYAAIGKLRGHPRASVAPISRNVWYLGFTSLFTDISSEMVASVLPAYLVLGLGFTPLAFGAVDGLYQGIGSVVRWASGAAADRWRRHKSVAAAGYLLSAVCKLGLLATSGWTSIAAVIAADRMGKGIRTAPRDAMIAMSSAPPALGAAFGLHRSLDAAGALLGPLVAFAVLAATPRRFDNVFVLSFSAAIVGLGVLIVFVDDRRADLDRAPPVGPTGVLAALWTDRPFRYLIGGAAALSLATIGDAFVYLQVQRSTGFGAAGFPLMAFGAAGTYMLCAAPAGRFADRVGASRLFRWGHVVLFPLYALLWVGLPGIPVALACVLLLGLYYGFTDGVLAAAASRMLAPEVRATGLAVLGTAVSVSRLLASIAFGAAWTTWGPQTAIAGFAVALAMALPIARVCLATERA